MKIISEFVDGPVLPVPDNLKGLIASVADCGLTPREMAFCYGALRDLGEYVKTHPLPPSIGCCILFSDKDEITLAEEEECLLGEALSLAVIQLGRIRRSGPGYEKWLRFVLLEEVCHILYAVRNEYQVKEIVAEVLNQNPKSHVDLHEFFPDHFDEKCRRIPLPEYPIEWVREHSGAVLSPAVSSRMPRDSAGSARSEKPKAAIPSSELLTPGVCETRGVGGAGSAGAEEAVPGVSEDQVPEAEDLPPENTPGICKSVDRRAQEASPASDKASSRPAVIPGVCKTSASTIQKAAKSRKEAPSLSVIPGVCRSTLNQAMIRPDAKKKEEISSSANIPGVCRTIVKGILKPEK